jgi:hypothetical protein
LWVRGVVALAVEDVVRQQPEGARRAKSGLSRARGQEFV